MTQESFETKLVELDRLLNDMDLPVEPKRVWALLAEVASHDVVALAPAAARPDKGGARA